jgi:uncharacterized UPF0146 family protein
LFWPFKKSRNTEYKTRGHSSKIKIFELIGLFKEYAKTIKRHAKEMKENCSKTLNISNADVFSMNKFFERIREIFIIKKKKDMNKSLVPVNKCLFERSNIKNTLSKRIIEIM